MYRSSCWYKIKKRLEELEKTIKDNSSELEAGLNANSEADNELHETVVNHISTDIQTEPISSDKIQSLFS